MIKFIKRSLVYSKNKLKSIKLVKIISEEIRSKIILFHKKIFKKRDDKDLKINIGGGDYFRSHWRVLDFPSERYPFPSYYIDYRFDLTSDKQLFFDDNSVKFFYSSHTLEHIPQEFCQHIFNEFYRCLKKEGAIRLTMPDFNKAYEGYRNKNEKFFMRYKENNLKESFLNFFATFIRYEVDINEFEENFKLMKKEEFADYYTQKVPRNSQKIQVGHHINWWDYDKAKRMLTLAGFKNIYSSAPQKSKFIEMRRIGRKNGFDSTYPEISFFIEAIK